MTISAKIIADSIGSSGVRLTTFVLKYPRFFHSELMTHRAFSRNAASSRAIPTKKLRERTLADPAMPVWWGANQKGMQAETEVKDKDGFREWWLRGMDLMARHHAEAESKGYHKQIANRVIEPWMLIEVIITADQYGLAQMFHQRRHPAAQPEFQALAEAMWVSYQESSPEHLEQGDWHLPFIDPADRAEALKMAQGDVRRTLDILKAVSVGRCARVSYLNHEGIRSLEDDIALHDHLKDANPGHWSPFEHVAMATEASVPCANFTGWYQYRKQFANEWLTSMPEK